MQKMDFIPDGDRRLRKSEGYGKELAIMDERIEEMKTMMKQATPLQKREIESKMTRLIEQRKALCPSSVRQLIC